MKEHSRTALFAVIVSAIVITVMFFLFFNGGENPQKDFKAKIPGKSDIATGNGKEEGNTPGAVKVLPKKEGEAEEPGEVENPGDPVLAGTVFGANGGLPGATVLAFPFSMIQDLITKYESTSIGGLGDVPGLIKQVKHDIFSLRSRGSSALSNAKGRYEFYKLHPGEYVFLVTGPHHIFSAGDSTVVEKEVCHVHDFHLKPGQVIRGKVLDPEGRPVAGASVISLYQVQGLGALGKFVRKLLGFVNGEFLRGPFESITGADGRFQIDTLPPALYELNVKAPKYAETRVPNISTGTNEIVIQLGAGGNVRGVIIDNSGNPVPGVDIGLTSSEDKLQLPIPVPVAGIDEILSNVQRFFQEDNKNVKSDDNGLFVCEQVRPGSYELAIDSPGFLPAKKFFSIENGESVDLGNILLDRGGVIKGIVIDGDKRPVEKAIVCVQAQSGIDMERMLGVMSFLSGRDRALTGKDGRFVVSGIKRGKGLYRVVASKSTLGMGMINGASPDGPGVTVSLQPPWKVTGLVVLSGNKKPVAGAEVFGGGGKTVTDEDGRFILENVLPDGNQLLFGKNNSGLRIFARHKGFCPDQRIVKKDELSKDVILELRTEPLVGGIVRAEDGKPKAGAIVRLVPGRLPPVGGLDMVTFGVTFSDGDGKFSFGTLRYGMNCKAVATFPGYASGESEVFNIIPGSPVNDLEIVLVRGGKIIGFVTDGKNPVPGVKLRLHKKRPKGRQARMGMFLRMFGIPEEGDITYTNQDGWYCFDDIEPGVFSVTATAGAGITKTVDVEIFSEKEEEVDIELEVGGEISGVVVDVNNQPLPLAAVRLLQEGNRSLLGLQKAMGGALVSRTTDQNGGFVFSQVKQGDYTLIVEMDGFAPKEVSGVKVDQDPFIIVLEAEGMITGEVKFEGSEEPVTGFTVRIDREGKEKWDSPLKSWRGVNDPQGIFSYESLKAGVYMVEVRADNAAPGLASVKVESGKESFVTIRLSVPATISGVVVLGEEEIPVPGARVAVVGATSNSKATSSGEAVGNYFEERMKEISTVSDGDGVFVLNNVSAGTITIEASHKKYLPGRIQVSVEAGEEAQCKIVLREGYSLKGVVFDNEGNAEPERLIFIEGPDNIQKIAKSKNDGGWKFKGLKPGKYKLWCPTPDLSHDMKPEQVDISGDQSGVTLTLPPPADQVQEPDQGNMPGEINPADNIPRDKIKNIPEGLDKLRGK